MSAYHKHLENTIADCVIPSLSLIDLPFSMAQAERLRPDATLSRMQNFYSFCEELGFVLKLERDVSAMERLLPNVPLSPFRPERDTATHLLKAGLQSGLYVDLPILCSGPELRLSRVKDRFHTTWAIREYLEEAFAFTTKHHGSDIQSHVYVDVASGLARFVQYWIDYPSDAGYAVRHVDIALADIIGRMSRGGAVDLTDWVRPLAAVVRPALTELGLSPWQP